MKMNVFGKRLEVVRTDRRWIVFYLGAEGLKRLADDLSIPPDLAEDRILRYLADLCHEWETPTNNRAEILEP